MTGDYAGNISLQKTWEMLKDDPGSALIDVRTNAEWAYVGIPDVSSLGKQTLFVPWQLFPRMEVNPDFVRQVTETGVHPDANLLLLCRSGVRSKKAAIALHRVGFKACYNVDHGFEGDPDAMKHRGLVNGWKHDGLPWIQG